MLSGSRAGFIEDLQRGSLTRFSGQFTCTALGFLDVSGGNHAAAPVVERSASRTAARCDVGAELTASSSIEDGYFPTLLQSSTR